MKDRTRRVVNRQRRSVLKIDPTRTGIIRRQLATELRRRFARLKLRVVNLVLTEDAFGLRSRQSLYTANERWRFQSDPDKVRAFRDWLRAELGQDVLDEELWQRYALEGFAKGAGRAFQDVRGKQFSVTGDFFAGGQQEFLRMALGRPVAVEKVKLIAARAFDDLDDVTGTMANRMVRHLADGLVQGLGPREIARAMAGDIEGMGLSRALTIARTEIVRAHAEGQLMALEALGVEELGVSVEWSTTGDGRVCELCAPLEGVVLTLTEARGLIPRHPNCRCAFLPANVGEQSLGQKHTKASIAKAIRTSVKRGGVGWSGAGKTVAKGRPKGMV